MIQPILGGDIALGFLGNQIDLTIKYSFKPLYCGACGVTTLRMYVYNLWMGLCKECFTFALECKKDKAYYWRRPQPSHFRLPTSEGSAKE